MNIRSLITKAIEARQEVRRELRRPEAFRNLSNALANDFTRVYGTTRDYRKITDTAISLTTMFAQLAFRANLYVVANDIAQTLNLMADAVPKDTTLYREIVPYPFGWIQLPAPCFISKDDTIDIIAWGMHEAGDEARMQRSNIDEILIKSNWFQVYAWNTKSSTRFSYFSDLAIDKNLFSISSDTPNFPWQYRLNALTYTFLSFIRQKLFVVARGWADRATRRRYEREEDRELPPFDVVTLRQRAYDTDEREIQDVDWSCQWWVNPHWRHQAYGEKMQLRRWIVVPAHIKGPPDKPLKPPTEKIHQVVR